MSIPGHCVPSPGDMQGLTTGMTHVVSPVKHAAKPAAAAPQGGWERAGGC